MRLDSISVPGLPKGCLTAPNGAQSARIRCAILLSSRIYHALIPTLAYDVLLHARKMVKGIEQVKRRLRRKELGTWALSSNRFGQSGCRERCGLDECMTGDTGIGALFDSNRSVACRGRPWSDKHIAPYQLRADTALLSDSIR